MKKILCPFDFSDSSMEAARFAISYAEKLDSQLKFMYASSIIIPTGTVADVDLSAEQMQVKQEELENAIDKLYVEAGLTRGSNTICETDDSISVAKAITDEAKKIGADLIIMGTTGTSGIKRLLIGSVTASVLDHVSCPVLAVPAEFNARKIKKIGMPTDVVNAENEILSAAEFAQTFDAELNLFHVSVRQPNTDKFEQKLQFVTGYSNISFTEIHPDYEGDIVGGLNNYVDTQKPDMLIMNHKSRGWFGELLNNSKTKDMIFQSKTAVLTFKRQEE